MGFTLPREGRPSWRTDRHQCQASSDGQSPSPYCGGRGGVVVARIINHTSSWGSGARGFVCVLAASLAHPRGKLAGVGGARLCLCTSHQSRSPPRQARGGRARAVLSVF